MIKTSPLQKPRVWRPARSRPHQDPRHPVNAADDAVSADTGNLPDDWNLLIGKYKARHGIAGSNLQAPKRLQSSLHDNDIAGLEKQECVDMLERMHAELKQAREQRRMLEHQLLEAKAALSFAQNQLTGVQSRERQARHQARHDGLTTLPNRSFFMERLEEALAHAAREHQLLAVLYMDLDGFKEINDNHGHETGDELLRVVGARLTRAVRATDMVSRLGGDEFGCMITGLPLFNSHEQLDRIVAKLQFAVSAPFRIGNRSLVVRPSIGIAIYPADGTTIQGLLSHADTAMYHAKAAHTGHEFFDPLIHG